MASRRVDMHEPQEPHQPQEASTSPADVVVIGGGLAGLAAAAMVARTGVTVEVRERSREPGGLARSADKDGFTFNQGPHALYNGGPAERILTELGVVMTGGQPATKGLTVLDGKAQILPAGPMSMLRTKALGLRDKAAFAKLMTQVPKLDSRSLASTSTADWVDALVGTGPAAALAHAFVRLSTYCNDPAELSAEVAATQLQAALAHGVTYLDNGWQSLVDQLANLPGVVLSTGAAVDEVPDAAAVIIAAGGPGAASALLGRAFDVGPAAEASCIDYGLCRAPEQNLVLGADVPIYFSNHSAVAQLAPGGHHHAAVAQYLTEGEEPDVEALDNFASYAGVTDADVAVKRRMHRMTTVTAMATASRGGLRGRPAVDDTGHPNVFLAGDWVGPTGHLADAVLASAELAAQAAVQVVTSRPRLASR